MLGAPTSSRITSNGPRPAKSSGAIALTPSVSICSRQCSSRTVAVTRAPAIVPSCTAAMPTPPAAPWTSSRSPTQQLGLGEQRVVRGREDLGDAARRVPVELVGHRHRDALADHRQLGLAAAGDDRHHAVAQLEALDAAAHADHLAGQLETRDVRRYAGRRRIAPLELHHVGAVEAGGANADEQLAGLRLGVGMLLDGDRSVANRGGPHRPRFLHGTPGTGRSGGGAQDALCVLLRRYPPVLQPFRVIEEAPWLSRSPSHTFRPSGSRAGSVSRPRRSCAATSGSGDGFRAAPGARCC